jgi:hypothetical protein
MALSSLNLTTSGMSFVDKGILCCVRSIACVNRCGSLLEIIANSRIDAFLGGRYPVIDAPAHDRDVLRLLLFIAVIPIRQAPTKNTRFGIGFFK